MSSDKYELVVCLHCSNLHATIGDEFLEECAACGGRGLEKIEKDEMLI